MKYIELAISPNREHLDELLAMLVAAGFEEMVIEDPLDFLEIKEHPEWYKYDYINEELAAHRDDKPKVSLYFTDDEEGASLLDKARQLLNEPRQNSKGDAITDLPDVFEYSVISIGDDSEWLYKWQEHFIPTRIGERFVVKPSWKNCESAADDLVIEINPGMAFGSGLHETTSLCIYALEKIAKERTTASNIQNEDNKQGLSGLKVLDIGCGTGILSIAAALLGAEDCLGIDIDEDAVRIAKDNVSANGFYDCIEIAQGDLTNGIDYEPDIIVANLMADLVMRLAPDAAEQLKEGGIFISSGILDIKCEEVASAIMDAGLEIKEISEKGEWRAITALKY